MSRLFNVSERAEGVAGTINSVLADDRDHILTKFENKT